MNSSPLWEIVTQTQLLSFQESFNLLGHICFNISAIRLMDSHTQMAFPKAMVLFCVEEIVKCPHFCVWHSSIETRLKYLTAHRKTRHFQSQKAQDRQSEWLQDNSSQLNVQLLLMKGTFCAATIRGGGISEWFPCPGLFDKVYR